MGTFTESEIKSSLLISLWNFVQLNLLITKEAYDQLYSGDPTLHHNFYENGMGNDGRHRVTKMDYRFLNLLTTSVTLQNKRQFFGLTNCIQLRKSLLYAHIDLLLFYPIWRCLTTMAKTDTEKWLYLMLCHHLTQKADQRHNINASGARVNGKARFLLVWTVVTTMFTRLKYLTSILSWWSPWIRINSSELWKSLDWLTDTYVDALNIIHDWQIQLRSCSNGPSCQLNNVLTWIPVSVDLQTQLSAINTLPIKPIRDENGYIYDYETIGEYPLEGEDDPHVQTNWQNGWSGKPLASST